MQCIANSPYIRDFYTGVSNNNDRIVTSAAYSFEIIDKIDPPYKYQVNPNNVMGN